MATTTQSSLIDRVVAYQNGEAIEAACFLGDTPVLARIDGSVLFGKPQMATVVPVHTAGSILCTAATPDFLFTGGDDGLVARTDREGKSHVVHDGGGKWIDALVARPDGAFAFAIGKSVHAHDGKVLRSTKVATTARGLAFAPKGYRIAIAHYDGVSLWFPNSDAPPDPYEWKGSHLAASFSPDGRFLVSSMQEPALHGWRLSDRANMRMSGYPSRVRSMSWSHDGEWLATSGADSCVLWPFRDKDGPMKKPPHECAIRKAKIARVAFHPSAPLLAVGYEDGWILLSRPVDQAEILVRRPDADRHPITALAWNRSGDELLFGTESGEAGWLNIAAR